MCTDARRVAFATYLFTGEARTWWKNARTRLTEDGGELTSEGFKNAFLENYFPEEAKGKKETEFLELKQGNMSIGEYAAKFQELYHFHPHYQLPTSEISRCIRFEQGLRPDIKSAIGHDQVRNYAVLVEKCRIYENNEKEMKEFLREASSSKAIKKREERNKPYQCSFGNRGRSGGWRGNFNQPWNRTKFYTRCNRAGHFSNECPNQQGGQAVTQVRHGGNQNPAPANNPVIGRTNPAPNNGNRRPGHLANRGRVFAMDGSAASESQDLIHGTFYVDGFSLDVLYDSGQHIHLYHERGSNNCDYQ
jgi:hypothetical protein